MKKMIIKQSICHRNEEKNTYKKRTGKEKMLKQMKIFMKNIKEKKNNINKSKAKKSDYQTQIFKYLRTYGRTYLYYWKDSFIKLIVNILKLKKTFCNRPPSSIFLTKSG